MIKSLRDAAVLAGLYAVNTEVCSTMKSDADGLRNLLVETIAANHPEWPGEIDDTEYTACRRFLSHFYSIYSLNYDLLLYWAQMHTEEGEAASCDDGFRPPADGDDAEYVLWEAGQSRRQTLWFLHGALHLFDAGTEVRKYTWVRTQVRLIDQIRDALQREYFPLFVAEGRSAEKLERVRHSYYLAKAMRSFEQIGGTLFIYGHSLAPNDEHYLRLIERGNVERICVGVYGDASSAPNQALIARAQLMAERRALIRKRRQKNLEVQFFDAQTASVWGNN